jgi:hypothetical protein
MIDEFLQEQAFYVSGARGAIDRLCGGLRLRRGRRDAHSVRVGEALDFWRVEAVEPPNLFRLRAKMKVQGKRGCSSK